MQLQVRAMRGACWPTWTSGWGRAMTIKMQSGRKTRSVEEQLAKLRQKEQEQQEPEDMEPELSFGQNKKSRPIGGGTKTLAERLSQSLRDPLRSKDYLGTVDKGEIMIDCHHHSKVISFKNKKGYLSQHAMEQLVDIIKISDTNWYEKFSILKGGGESFCAGLIPPPASTAGRYRDAEVQGLLYRLAWLIARSNRRRIAVLTGPCLGAGAAIALSHWNPDEAQAFKLSTLGQDGRAMEARTPAAVGANHLRIGTGQMQLSFQNAYFLGGYPGVGASYFLPRLRGHIGTYLALTGARINVHDCLFAGAATHYVQTHRIEKLQKALTDADVNSSDDQLLAIVDDFAVGERERRLMQENAHVSAADPGRNDASYYQRYALNGVTDPTHLETHLEAINACFGQPSIEELMEQLRELEAGGMHAGWATRTLNRLQMMSPTSLRISFTLLRRGASAGLDECIRTVWRLAHRTWADLNEGVRAFEKDKDGKPEWSAPPSPEEVQALFQPIDAAQLRPLNLTQDHLQSAARERKF